MTEIRRMADAYHKDGKTLEEIGQMQTPPITRERVRQIFEEHNIERRPRGEGRIYFSPDVRSEIVSLYKSGMSMADVGNSLEPPVSVGVIRRVLNEEGVLPRGLGEAVSAKFNLFLMNEAPRLRALERNGMTRQMIADAYGKSIATIFRWFRRLNCLEESNISKNAIEE